MRTSANAGSDSSLTSVHEVALFTAKNIVASLPNFMGMNPPSDAEASPGPADGGNRDEKQASAAPKLKVLKKHTKHTKQGEVRKNTRL